MTFEFDGKKYENASTHQKEWGNEIILELKLNGKEKILDLGCGDGKLTENLSDLVPKGFVLGIDASQGMIDIAQQKEKDNLKFKLLDINKLNLSERFDVIFSNATLHWVKDHQNLWRNIKNILTDNGIVRFNFAAEGNCSHFFKIIRSAMMLDEFKEYFRIFEWPWYMPSIDEYKTTIEKLPFSEKKVWGENKDRYFPDKNSIVGWIDQPSIVPFLKYIEESKKKKFRNHVVEQMLIETKQENNTYFETFRRINVFVKN